MSSTVAALGMLIVLLIPPLIPGWIAAIISRWPCGAMKRTPSPQRFAQSKTAR